MVKEANDAGPAVSMPEPRDVGEIDDPFTPVCESPSALHLSDPMGGGGTSAWGGSYRGMMSPAPEASPGPSDPAMRQDYMRAATPIYPDSGASPGPARGPQPSYSPTTHA